jgi:hypothetical protein
MGEICQNAPLQEWKIEFQFSPGEKKSLCYFERIHRKTAVSGQLNASMQVTILEKHHYH